MYLRKAWLTKLEVCYLLGITPITLDNWYRYIEKTPPEDIPQNCPGLPPYKFKEDGRTKIWHGIDLHHLYDFQKWIPRGRAGKMGRTNEIFWSKKHRKNNKDKE